MDSTLVDSGEVTVVYALDDVKDVGTPQRVHELHELGRFARNMARGKSLWFTGRQLSPIAEDMSLHCELHGILDLRLDRSWLYSSSYGCVQLAFKAAFATSSAHTVAQLLECTCHERDGITLGGTKPLLELVDALELGTGGSYGLDVHSVVALDHLPQAWGRDEFIQVVYRETERRPRHDIPVAEPAELNRFEGQVGMHGRGVTLLIGHDVHTVTACTLVAQGLMMLIQQIRSLEARAGALLQEATELTQGADTDYSAPHIDRVAALAAEVQRLNVLVATEVESVFANGSLPEIVLDSYRESLARTLGVPEAIRATSRTLTKVREFISGEFERMSSDHREVIAKRERTRALLAAGASTVFLPTSLFLAALAMGTTDINRDASLFSAYYRPLWIVYIIVMIVGAAIVVAFGWKRK